MGIVDTVQGLMSRRVLLNYRIDPDVLRRVLPSPFRPKLYDGVGMGGICMIRFKNLRPRFFPEWFGLGSENAAHRIAVEWEQDGELYEGVYVPRRDTNSVINSLVGGRLFPGIFSRSTFKVDERRGKVSVSIVRQDGGREIDFAGKIADEMPASSVFPSLDAATEFFLRGSTGYSKAGKEGHYHGMELECIAWGIRPMVVETAESCFFGDIERFPRGAVELDCALLMNDIEHRWHGRPDLYLDPQSLCFTAECPKG